MRDTIPFHEVQDIWIAGKSPQPGRPATNPRKITSDSIVDEVVFQCEFADRSVPSPIAQVQMDELISQAEKARRPDLIQEMEKKWEPYVKNPNDGNAAADRGATLVIARHELFLQKCSRSRLCPNCTMELPKTLLSCPQCKGRFISAGVTHRSAPVDVILTKEEIQLVRWSKNVKRN